MGHSSPAQNQLLGIWDVSLLSATWIRQPPPPGHQGPACQRVSLNSLGRCWFQSLPYSWPSQPDTEHAAQSHHLAHSDLWGWCTTASLATQSHGALNWVTVSGSRWQCPAVDIWHSSISMWESDCLRRHELKSNLLWRWNDWEGHLPGVWAEWAPEHLPLRLVLFFLLLL